MSNPPCAGKPSQDLRDQTKFLETKTKQQPFGEVAACGDDSLAKVRKPYTITKQRERWTEEEHQKFLEALKLYGRAWRRIEEHIGTKTAVQIRSHAQKFFSKLEREQATGSIVPGTAQDIDIPPPRPKRKPSHPYPRKASMESPGALSPKDFDATQCLTSMAMGNVMESCRGELKLFGHTVVVPTATRAVALEVNNKMETELQKNPSNASDVSMLASENDSSNDQNGNVKKDGIADQQQELAALYYSKFWESLQASDGVLPSNLCVDRANSTFPLWQPSLYTAAALGTGSARTGWPNIGVDLTSAAVRNMPAGSSSDIFNTENSPAAFAAATLAAASAWWALQSSVQPGFLPQCMFPIPEAQMHEAEAGNAKTNCSEMPQDDDENTNASPSPKRLSTFEESEKRRVRSRSFKEDQPPSSSGSDDGDHASALANGDGDASGNSGPSSNSSRCGAAEAAAKSEMSSSDKEKTGEETVTEEAATKTSFTPPSFQHPSVHHPAQSYRFRRCQRSARPCRSSGSEGEQRKEVSQEGRMAFQALFSHQKLPQTFSHRSGLYHQQQCCRRLIETSDLESVSGIQNITQDDTYTTYKISRSSSAGISSIVSGSGPAPSILSSAASKHRRRSGFVPYCRTSSGGNNNGNGFTGGANPTRSLIVNEVVARGSLSCGLEGHQQSPSGNTRRPLIVEEEGKLS